MQALDRVLAEDIISPVSVPPHDNSAMDGFAFRGSELAPGRPCRCGSWARRWPVPRGVATWARASA
jgi:molybdopterin biosynthesis enzyme